MAESAATALLERQLLAMEDERDAALLDVERLQQVVDNGQKMIADLRGYRDEAMKFAEDLDRHLGAANRATDRYRLEAAALAQQVAALELAAQHLLEQRDELIVERDAARAAIARVRAQCAKPEFPLGLGAAYVPVHFVLAALDSVAAGGGATPGETPAATDQRYPDYMPWLRSEVARLGEL